MYWFTLLGNAGVDLALTMTKFKSLIFVLRLLFLQILAALMVPSESSLQHPCPCRHCGLDYDNCFDQWDMSKQGLRKH